MLITGESGSGKSTLFRAIAGLWPWGSGVIRTPPSDQQMFMPQRPYLPLGTLRAGGVLSGRSGYLQRRCRARGARALRSRRSSRPLWTGTSAGTSTLSLGQQQRVAFARLLLHRPAWVFMDEATSALDDDSQASMLSLFDEELNGTTILSIAHRPGIEAFHTRTLRIVKTPQGAKLFGRRQPIGRGRSWWRRWLELSETGISR